MKEETMPQSTLIKKRLLDESKAMIKYLSSEGKPIPTLAEKLMEENVDGSFNLTNKDILLLHKQLSQKVQPAKPKTILLLYQESEKGKWLKFLGPVKLVRQLMATTLISLILFIVISLSGMVNKDSVSLGILNSSGIELFLNLSFLITAAALGGCFSALFQVNKFINAGTYDPKFESSYWIRLLLGLVAGLMIAVIIPVSTDINVSEGNVVYLTIPLLAMLGGFSASLVYRILTRIVWAVESLFIGKREDLNEQKLMSMQAQHDHEKLVEQQNYSQFLTKIKSEISAKKPFEEIIETIDSSIKKVLNEN